MRIGIIGAGNMGAALAAQRTQAGHQVAIANSRGPRTLAGVAAQTGAVPVPLTEVTRNADVVIAAIPEKSIPGLPAGLLSSLPADVDSVKAQLVGEFQHDGLTTGCPSCDCTHWLSGRPASMASMCPSRSLGT